MGRVPRKHKIGVDFFPASSAIFSRATWMMAVGREVVMRAWRETVTSRSRGFSSLMTAPAISIGPDGTPAVIAHQALDRGDVVQGRRIS